MFGGKKREFLSTERKRIPAQKEENYYSKKGEQNA